MAVRAARLAVFAVTLVAGCTPPLVLRDQTVHVGPTRIAGAPPAILTFELTNPPGSVPQAPAYGDDH